MEHPVRVAFCPILFSKNGGRFDSKGLPIFSDPIRGRCDIAWDCFSCSFLQEWTQYLSTQGWSVGWECIHCLRETRDLDEAAGLERRLPGFFSAGRDPAMTPEDPDFDPDRPSLVGCTHVKPPDGENAFPYVCGWQTSILQLVIRRKKP